MELMKCARITNEAYEIRIFTSISSCVVFIITFLYSLYSISISNNYDNWMNEFYSHFYWIFYFAIKIFAINNICETTMAEVWFFLTIFFLEPYIWYLWKLQSLMVAKDVSRSRYWFSLFFYMLRTLEIFFANYTNLRPARNFVTR